MLYCPNPFIKACNPGVRGLLFKGIYWIIWIVFNKVQAADGLLTIDKLIDVDTITCAAAAVELEIADVLAKPGLYS